MTIEPTVWVDTETRARIELTSAFGEPKKYAVRIYGNCLSKDNEWEYEPLPSSRDSNFLENCRWDSYEQAEKALYAADYSFLNR